MRCLVLLAFVFAGHFGISQKISWNHSENNLTIISSNVGGFTTVISTGNIDFIPVNAEGKQFYQAIIDGYTNSLKVGSPNLPSVNRLFEIPIGAKVEVEIVNIDVQYLDLNTIGVDDKLFPSQPPAVKSDESKQEFAYNKMVYGSNKFFRNEMMKVDLLGIYRDVNLARFSFNPLEYNPVTNKMKVVTRAKIRVKFIDGDIESTMKLKAKSYSPQFQLAQDLILNKNIFKLTQQDSVQYPVKYVIISDTIFRSSLQPFIKWKNQQGYKVIEAWEQNPSVGTSQSGKKAYLQSLYNNSTPADPAPTYVLFVGDVSEITPYQGVASSSHVTDLYYCEFTNDEFPEYLYGRFSVENNMELMNIVEKTIEYEKLLVSSTNYMDTSIIIAGSDGTFGPTHGNGQVNYGTSTYYNSAHGITAKAYLYPASSGNAALIRADASKGAAFINYTAHGSYDGWADPSFNNTHVAQMTNYQKYPLMIGNACLTGKFDQNDCFGEVLTNASKKGAIGYVGASNNTYWDEDFYWAVGYTTVSANPSYGGSGRGIYDGIFHDHGEPSSYRAISLGQISQCGNMAVTQSGSSSTYYWEVYHAFGDPSLVHYSIKPTAITALYNPMIFIGTSSVFTVQTEPHALVGLSLNDTLISSSYADSLGQANLYYQNLNQIGNGLLVITAQNKIPIVDTIFITIPNGPYLMPFDYSYNDLSGNNNGKADNNETVKLSLKIKNIANFATGGVVAKLTTNEQSIIITDSIQNIGSFAGLDTIDLVDAFTFNVSNNAIDKNDFTFTLQITDSSNHIWNSSTNTKTYAPVIQLLNMVIDDSQANGNGIIEPGEIVTANIYYSNTGSNIAFMANGNLVSGSTNLVVLNNYSKDTIFAGDTIFASFQLQVAQSVSIGSIHQLDFNLVNSYNSLSGNYPIVIGLIDEDFETGDFSKYLWNGNSNIWIIDTAQGNVFSGDYSSRSMYIADDETSTLSIELNVLQPDSIAFYRRVSSEEDFDYLNFYIDGFMVGRWSGYKSWAKVYFPISSGHHNLLWEYAKDYNTIGGQDAAWIDDIVFPPCDLLSGISNQPIIYEGFKAYPNPASNYVTIDFSLNKASTVFFMIVDINGKIVSTSPKTFKPSGKHSQSLVTTNLENGTYTIMMYNNNSYTTSKLIITK